MAKPNYQHARKQKEQARKSRQLKKEQRRTDRTKPESEGSEGPLDSSAAVAGTPDTSGG